MSEITPNTPNPVREDALMKKIMDALGGDYDGIQTPVWRNEEELAVIAKALAAVTPSSGGGVLTIDCVSESDVVSTVKKQNELYVELTADDFVYAILKIQFGEGEYVYYPLIIETQPGSNNVNISAADFGSANITATNDAVAYFS